MLDNLHMQNMGSLVVSPSKWKLHIQVHASLSCNTKELD
jgi:hypothetical protein